MRKLFLLVLLSLVPQFSYSDEVEFDHKRTIVIAGPINSDIVPLAAKLVDLAKTKDKPINLLIESPGGSVFTGFIFLNAMKMVQAQGVKINCIVPSYAASMAFIIFAYCNKRYAFDRSLLLFHPMGINFMGKLNVPLADTIKKQFDILGSSMDDELAAIMGMSDRDYHDLNRKELFWIAGELAQVTSRGFITIISSIKGLPHLFDLQSKYSRPAFGTKTRGQKSDPTCSKCHKKPHKDKNKNLFPEYPGIKLNGSNKNK